MEAVDSRHSGCIAEVKESDTTVIESVGVMRWEVLSQRAEEQGRSLLESGSWSGGRQCADRLELKQRMDPGGLEGLVRLVVMNTGPWMHT